jgi:hypothetical protein
MKKKYIKRFLSFATESLYIQSYICIRIIYRMFRGYFSLIDK